MAPTKEKEHPWEITTTEQVRDTQGRVVYGAWPPKELNRYGMREALGSASGRHSAYETDSERRQRLAKPRNRAERRARMK